MVCFQDLTVTMNRVILLFCLHVTAVLARGNISCNIPAVKPMETTSIACKFPKDISLSKTDFSIHHVNITKPVVDCLWAQGELNCFNSPGYEINRTVTSQLTVWIHSVSTNLTGEYYCKMADSTGYDIHLCQLALIPQIQSDITAHNETGAKEINSLAIGLGIALPAVAVIFVITVILLRKKMMSRKRQRRDSTDGNGDQPMIPKSESHENIPISSDNEAEATTSMIQEGQNTVTKEFQAFLENKVKEMYPDIPTKCYFVPPAYFNKTRFKEDTEAGEVVYVPCSTKNNETEDREYVNVLRHDQAMQHFLHCLHGLAESEHEQMLVLTQFQYGDYLKDQSDAYMNHSLPMPSDLKDVNGAGCFDFLIVHRQHGVMVGVVKAVSADGAESQVSEQKSCEIINEVEVAVGQLEKARHMIKHLMSDQQKFPEICGTLILPNLPHKSLLDAVENCESLLKRLRVCLGVKHTQDPTERCVCSEDLSEKNTPWNVSPEVVSNLRFKWNWTITGESTCAKITDEQFFAIAARFLGPATQSVLDVPEGYVNFTLPKTIAETVSLTGDLYSRSILPSDLKKKLKEPKLVLVGTPNTGKTRIFTIIGRKWLSEGHDVVIVKDTSFPSDSFLLQHLSAFKEKSKSQSATEVSYGNICEEKCNLSKDKSIEKCVKRITQKKKNSKNDLFVLLDVAHLEGNHVTNFYDAMCEEDETIHLWIGCTGSVSPAGVPSVLLTEILNCPPAVVRETSTQKDDKCTFKKEKGTVSYLPPTDGPAVKHINHKKSGKLWKSIQDCEKCGREVGSFLRDALLIETETQAPLKFKDILILFEFNTHLFAKQEVSEKCGFLKGLEDSGIKVRAVNNGKVDDDDSDCASAMNVKRMQTHRRKSKIVVYVETIYDYSKDEENKRRALTSCTSQLIFVHSEK